MGIVILGFGNKFNKYSDELIKKPHDKDFLNRFISRVSENGRILDVGCSSTPVAVHLRFQKIFWISEEDY